MERRCNLITVTQKKKNFNYSKELRRINIENQSVQISCFTGYKYIC